MTAQLALAISFLSFCVSTLTFYRGSMWAQNKRMKMEKMRLVAARSILIWDQKQTVIAAKKHGSPLDPYFFPSYQRNIRRLEEAIDEAVAVGLLEDLFGDQEHALALHCAFTQSLAHMEVLDSGKAEIDDWIKLHFIMGMVRLLDRCIQLHEYTLPKAMRTRITQEISPLKNEAWTYIHE